MSSSCLKSLAGLILVCAPAAAWTQQTYFIPDVQVSAERHTNRVLAADSAQQQDSSVYNATLAARLGRATPRSQTELRPRLVFQEFPDQTDVDRVDGFLDLRSSYKTLKGGFDLVGRYARQDVFTAELGEAAFDPFDPDNPTSGDTGLVTVRGTRTSYQLVPSFNHELTERLELEGTLQFDAVRYDSNIAGSKVGYDSPYLELAIVRELTPLSGLGIGPYASRYEAEDNSNKTDTYGVVINYNHRWSEISRASVTLRVERDESTDPSGLEPDSSSTAWGIEFTGYRRNQVGGLRYGIGRFLRPSTLGARREQDQFRIQYDRPFSAKSSFNTAIRLTRDQNISSDGGNDSRDRAFFDLGLSRQLTPTWYLSGGYRFIWQQLGADTGNANNHMLFLGVGYRGLQPPSVERVR
jgi:hypothetical protein